MADAQKPADKISGNMTGGACRCAPDETHARPPGWRVGRRVRCVAAHPHARTHAPTRPAALCVYSCLFMRFAWAVQARSSSIAMSERHATLALPLLTRRAMSRSLATTCSSRATRPTNACRRARCALDAASQSLTLLSALAQLYNFQRWFRSSPAPLALPPPAKASS
jgi:hypothetical protein